MMLSHPNGRPICKDELSTAECGDWFYDGTGGVCVVLGWTSYHGELAVLALGAEGIARDFDWRIGTSVWDRVEVHRWR